MEMSKLIKTFREAQDMSQDTLAHMVGYTDRSSIAKIEKGGVDLPRSKLIAFARVLHIPRDVLLDSAFEKNPVAEDVSAEFLAAVYAAGYDVARGYDDNERAFNDLVNEAPPPEIYNMSDLHTGRIAQFSGDELRELDPTVKAVRAAFSARYLIPSRVDMSARAETVGILYDHADERDRKLVDTVLDPYDDGTFSTESVLTCGRIDKNAALVELIVFEDQLPAAGYSSYFDSPRNHTETFPASVIPARVSFGVPVSGNSMEPRYMNHATAFVQSTPRVENGEVGLFSLNGEPYIKQLIVDDKKREVRLHSFNPAYADIVIHELDDLRTLGRVLGSYSA